MRRASSRIDSAALERRRANIPRPTYPEELPVVARREEIARAIQQHSVVIVCGETGSGKTTQLPKICLELGRGVAGMIGHTQPRRIAARTVAARIASELRSSLGHAVGYKVRFSDNVSRDTYVKVMTDGILLAETQHDRELEAYDTLIIDEAHERSLNIDFLLGYVKRLVTRRPELKVIVTSATIDAERFARHFAHAGAPAPVVEVSGRLYPVETRYRPLKSDDEDEEEQEMEEAIVAAVDELTRERATGDVLIFLPGEREIRETAEALRKHASRGAEILPLYARLSFEEQERVFHPTGARRIVLATNVAETSLTVPGIRYVIDTGLARLNRYSYRNKVEQLQVEKISRASANQRAGRCGRVAAGICVRLYSEDDFAARAEFTDPEILRSSLATVILRMKSLRIGDVEDFPFLEAPASRMIADGYQLLAELGAVDDSKELTNTGWQLARFPIDPRVARMILAAHEHHCLAEVLVIASVLEVQDPRERPFERAGAADDAHSRFVDERSDFMAFLKLWAYFTEAVKHKQSNRKLVEEIHASFLSYRRLREWRDVHRQLHELVAEMGMRVNTTPATPEQIHRALLAGLLGNIGVKADDGEYQGARGIKFAIFPGSGLRKNQPKWLVAAELSETARLYARCVARVEPEWIEAAAGPLANRQYFDPHWDEARAQVMAYERVTLYGLTLVPRRRVAYGRINPVEAREVLIRAALVAGAYKTDAPFYRHNQALVKEVQALEHKARRQDVLVDEEAIFAFYDARIGADLYSGASFEAWRVQAERENPKLLFMAREDLMRRASGITEAQFPDRFDVDGTALRLTYRFEPGHVMDGVTLALPLALLNRIDEARTSWLVPGMIREKVTACLKALPKQLRRHFVPVPDSVTAFLTECERGEREEAKGGEKDSFPPLWGKAGMGAESLEAALATFAQRTIGAPLPPDVWKNADIPAHLEMNYRVIDDSGRELAMGRDLAKLKRELGQAAQLTFGTAHTGIEREHIMSWDFGELPETLAFTRGGRKLTGYPALVDEGDSVAIRLFDVREAAAASMRAGVRRLMRLELKDAMRGLAKTVRDLAPPLMQMRTIAASDDMQEDLIAAIVDRAFVGEDALPRSAKEYEAQKARGRTRLPAVSSAAARMFAAIAQEYHVTAQKLAGAKGPLSRVAAELRSQLTRFVYKGFFSATPWDQLQHLPRYLKAMQVRLDKYPANPERDAKHAAGIAELWKLYEERADKLRQAGITDAKLEEFRWHIEELRVSLFAQELKTPFPVSVKRLWKAWGSVART
jgi:ATP-dependent helicase HrpA